MVIKFLKLPLKRKSGDLKNQLREVEDPNRKEVFRACLTVRSGAHDTVLHLLPYSEKCTSSAFHPDTVHRHNSVSYAVIGVTNAISLPCTQFLRNFMVVGDLDGSTSCAPSSANQAAVLPSLELLLSFLDTQDLPASDTVIALFVKNQVGLYWSDRSLVGTGLPHDLV